MKYTQKIFENKDILEKLSENAETIYNRLYSITRNIKSDGRRLLKDIVFGFSKVKNISLLWIAKVLSSKNTKNKVASFSKFLSWNTAIKYMTKYVNYVIKQLWKEKWMVYVVIDGWDIKKEYSKNSAMSKIHDWSTGKIEKWIVLETAIAFNDKDETVPIMWNIFSRKTEEYKSDNNETMKLINKIEEYKPKNVKIMYIWDRWYAYKELMEFIRSIEEHFLIRLKKWRYVKVKWKTVWIENAYTKLRGTKEEIEVVVKNWKIRWRLYYGKVKLYESNNRRDYYLVVVKNNKQNIMLLTSKKVRNQKEAKEIVMLYSKRWLIEEFYRYVKQEYKLEKIHLREWKEVKKYIKRMNNYYNLLLSTIWLIMLWLDEIWDAIKEVMLKLRAIENVWYKLKNIMICWLEVIQEYLLEFKVLQNQYRKKQLRKKDLLQNPLF